MNHTQNSLWDILRYLKADKILLRATALLSVGTFLESFDLFLYAHMAMVLDGLFFPTGDPNTKSLISAFALCSAFLFRPFGALLFGYIGDVYGRKVTVVITTIMMAITCLIMANAPTYDQVGITAAWIITFCRILQGITSMGELIAARVFLTEATPLPARLPVVGLIDVCASSGGLAAIAVGCLATSKGFNWRIAFWIGAGVSLVGSLTRTYLRESVEYADARKRLENVAKSAGEKVTSAIKQKFYATKISLKTALAYMGLLISDHIFLYFVYFHCPTILKNQFQYTVHQILLHNLLIGIIQLITVHIFRIYLTTITHPLKILRYNWIAIFILSLLAPWLLSQINMVWHLFLIQVFMLIFKVWDFPAVPILYKKFPLFKRFTAVSLLYSTAYAFTYIITVVGLKYLTKYCGNWGLLVLTVPTLTAYGFGLNYFIQGEKREGQYPALKVWPVLESIPQDADEGGWVSTQPVPNRSH